MGVQLSVHPSHRRTALDWLQHLESAPKSHAPKSSLSAGTIFPSTCRKKGLPSCPRSIRPSSSDGESAGATTHLRGASDLCSPRSVAFSRAARSLQAGLVDRRRLGSAGVGLRFEADQSVATFGYARPRLHLRNAIKARRAVAGLDSV